MRLHPVHMIMNALQNKFKISVKYVFTKFPCTNWISLIFTHFYEFYPLFSTSMLQILHFIHFRALWFIFINFVHFCKKNSASIKIILRIFYVQRETYLDYKHGKLQEISWIHELYAIHSLTNKWMTQKNDEIPFFPTFSVA